MVTEDKGLGFASQKETEDLEEGKGGIRPYPSLALGLLITVPSRPQDPTRLGQ